VVVRKDAEKSLSARGTTIGADPQQTFKTKKGTLFNQLSRDALQFEIAAFQAMGVPRKSYRNPWDEKTPVTPVTAPWSQPCQCTDQTSDPEAP
jgi:hypothetical protein